MATPQDITRNPDDSVVPVTWGEGGAVTEPSAGKKNTGWLAETVDKETLNWISREPMRWLRALFSRFPNASENLLASWLVRNGVWANGINPLEGFLSDAAVTDSLVADVWLDPPSIDTGAVRVQVSVAKASPHTFPATRDTYVFVPIDSLAPPTITEPELTFIDVPVSDPAPATPAGTVGVWRVETDGTSIVDQSILIPIIPVYRSIGIMTLAVLGDLDLGGDLTVSGVASLDGNTTIGDAVGDTLVVTATSTFLNMVTMAGDLVVDGDTFINGNANLGNAAGDAITVNGTPTFIAPASFNGNVTLGNAVGDAIEFLGTTTVSEVFNFEATATVIGASGGALTSDAGANLTWNGRILANGRLSVLTGTGVAAGDLSKAAGDELRYHDGTQNNYVHYSPLGRVLGIGDSVGGTAADGVPTGNLSSVTVDPSVAGKVKVSVTMNADFETDSTTLTIELRDVTAGTTINGGGSGVVINANYRNSATTFIRNSFEGAEFTYTLPSAASRTFAARLEAGGGDVNYVDLTVTVIGVV